MRSTPERRLLLLFLALCSLSGAWAQQRYSLRHYTNEDGLPANATKGMQWDSINRLLWIGTEGGLVRWDGSNFQTMSVSQARVLEMGIIDRATQTFYATCDDEQVYILQRGEARPLRRGTDSIRFLPISHTPGSTPPAQEGLRRHVTLWPYWAASTGDGSGDYLQSEGSNVLLVQGARSTVLSAHMPGVQFITYQTQLLLNHRGVLWRYVPARHALERIYLPGAAEELHVIANDHEHPPFVQRGTTLYRLSPARDNRWSLETVLEGLPAGAQPFLVRELPDFGMIVLGDRINGIYALRRKSITQLTDATGKIPSADLVTYGQALLPDGRILSHSGLVYDRSGPVPSARQPVGGSPHLYRFDGHLYFPHAGSLFRYNLATKTSEQLASMEGIGWESMCATRGQIYFITRSLVAHLAGNRIVADLRFTDTLGSANTPVLDAIEWQPGVLLLGWGNSVRLLNVDKGSTATTRVSEKAFVRYLWRRPYGVFVCTYGEGVFLLLNGKSYPLPRDKEGYLRFAHSIAPDGHGFCYISTNHGLFKVSEAALHGAALSGAPVYYHYLGKEDGLEQTELNGGAQPSFLQLPDGTLSFPTISGLAQLHPDSVQTAPPRGIILVHASADGKEINSFPAQFPASTGLFRFDVTVPSWGAPENAYAWYRLHRSGGSDDTAWIAFDPAQHRRFEFNSLKWGEYDFEVRTFNGFAPGDFVTHTARFEVQPPWYVSKYFVLLWLLLLAALLWLILHLRTAQLRARSMQLEATVTHRTQEIEEQKSELGRQLRIISDAHELKERLIAVIGHNIITPLRYIHRATTMMRDDARSLDPALREKAVDSINDTSLELELLSVNLLNWIKLQHTQVHLAPEAFSFSEIADHVKSLLGPVAKSKDGAIVVEDRCSGRIYHYKDALQVIVYNLVLNATTHSGGTRTWVRCGQEADQYLLEISDNGTGISPALQRKLLADTGTQEVLRETDNHGKGFGFLIIRDLVRLIGGQLTFDNSRPGTTICLRFSSLPETRGSNA